MNFNFSEYWFVVIILLFSINKKSFVFVYLINKSLLFDNKFFRFNNSFLTYLSNSLIVIDILQLVVLQVNWFSAADELRTCLYPSV